jgi:hypothetical protein
MPNKNNNKNKKTRKRIPRTLLPVLAATAAYAATTPTPVNPYPETYAFCHLPEGETKYKCEYSQSLEAVVPSWNPSIHGHVYTLQGTPGADPKAIDNVGCPINLNSRNRSECRRNRTNNLTLVNRRNNHVIGPWEPHYFSEGFRFPTYEEMQQIKAADPTAPDPREPASRWKNYLQFCKEFPKICGAAALIAALGLGTAVYSNKKEYNSQVREGTRKYLRKLANEERKFTRSKGNQGNKGKGRPSWAPKR